MIQAKIVADSKNEFGNRITTMVVTFPRFILAELNTHRMFSRNSASSRAIPFEKMLKSVGENPFVPIAWQKDHKGMQGNEYFTDENDISTLVNNHLHARDAAIAMAKLQSDLAVTKQLCNRLLEPFMWHTVIITATEWENFFALRCPKYMFHDGIRTEDKEYTFRSRKDAIEHFGEDEAVEYATGEGDVLLSNLTNLQWLKLNMGQAEIHMMALAEAMWDAFNESEPKLLQAGEWHIPFEGEINEMFDLTQNEIDKDEIPFSVKIGSIMAARTSYTVVGTELSTWSIDKYVEKCNELSTANPLHASPFEHCARTMSAGEFDNSFHKGDSGVGPEFYSNGWSGNFRGFIQYRKLFSNENIS